jgi:hypothetical protein
MRRERPNQTIYLYTSIWHEDVYAILPYLDGIHFTLHQHYKEIDICTLAQMQTALQQTKSTDDLREGFSARLAVDPDIGIPLPIVPSCWSEIRTKYWRTEKECIVPVHEDLFIWRED